jgi:hypothetical protein
MSRKTKPEKELLGYGRVSTQQQDGARQKAALRRYGCKTIYFDTASGKSMAGRPDLARVLDRLDSGKELVIAEWDRATRSMWDGLQIIKAVIDAGATITVLDRSYIDLTTPMGRGFMAMMSAMAEDERLRIIKRTHEGRQIARAKGVRMGRKPKLTPHQIKTDGFVFCSVEARNDGVRGYVTCAVDNTIIAAASVHNYHYNDCWLQYASFCAPYAEGSVVEVTATPTSGTLWFSVWQIPSTSQAWKFTKPERLTVRARSGGDWLTAETDGFLNGVVTVPGDGPRGILRLDCVRDQNSYFSNPIVSARPLVTAAAHVWHPKDRWISHASAMMPVRRGYLFSANFTPTSGAPEAQAYWTGVVPIT